MDAQEQTKTAMLVVYKTNDFKTWHALKNDEVPSKVKEPNIMASLVNGLACQLPGDPAWYGVKKLEKSE